MIDSKGAYERRWYVVVQELLEAGAAVDGPSGAGLTPLQEAAFAGHASIVTLLLRAKADKEVPSHPRGWTALHLAASRGRVGVLRILLKAGANENTSDKVRCSLFQSYI